jgi:hypothetical protein
MQGSVSGYIWIQNDPAYRDAEFGRNRRYWKGRLRAAAFALAYSELFEIGPVSEASIGAIQAFYPQQGFVDHIITPVVGLGWIIAEDVVDKYVIQRWDHPGIYPWVRMLLRGLNPSRSFANTFAGHVPWYRYTRADVYEGMPGSYDFVVPPPARVLDKAVRPSEADEAATIAPFELSVITNVQTNPIGSSPCVGGGGAAAFRVASQWQLALDVGGCKMTGMQKNFSGDSLHYMMGPRWTYSASGHWRTYLQVLFGGQKLTQEEMFPAVKAALEAEYAAEGKTVGFQEHLLYTKDWEASGVAFKAGGGVEYRLTSALELRVAELDYMRAWIPPMNNVHYSSALQFTTGLILRMGTW